MRGFDRAVYVATGQLVNALGSGIVYPFATIHFHLEVGIALSLVGLGLLPNNVALARHRRSLLRGRRRRAG